MSSGCFYHKSIGKFLYFRSSSFQLFLFEKFSELTIDIFLCYLECDWCNAMLPNENNLQNILAKKVLGSFFCFTTMKPGRI